MAFTLTIAGTITRNPGGTPVSGMTVNMKKTLGGSTVDTDVTDASGNYDVSVSLSSETFEDYYADPVALAPHFSDPGVGPEHAHEHTSYENDDFISNVVNTNPTRQTVGDREYEENTGSHFVNKTMSDADAGDVLTPVKISGEAWGAISKINNTTYAWEFNTDGAPVGEHDFSYRIDDDWGGSSSTETFTVTITSGNQAPSLTNPGTKTFSKNSGNQTFQLSATDPDDDPLFYSKVSGSAWGSVNSSSGLVTINTNNAPKGTHSFTWRASDGSLTDSETHNVVISNTTPSLTQPPNKSYNQDIGVQTLQLTSTDQDGDTPSYSKTVGPAWGTVNASSGLISFDTSGVTADDYTFTWRVSDGTATNSKTHTVTITVPEPTPTFQVIA